jgi:uncharacterized membrane protein YphA (DoxX/SURF4 family)
MGQQRPKIRERRRRLSCNKAIRFLANMIELQGILGKTDMGFYFFGVLAIGHIIVFIHFLGGLFIALGLHKRLACLVQIPMLIGAIVLLSVVVDNVNVAEQHSLTLCNYCSSFF